MDNRIVYDWVSFTSKIHDVTSVIDLLGLSDVTFESVRGINGYRDGFRYNDIIICCNGRDDMGILVNMSGKGCRTFETDGNGDYDSLFAEILENYSVDAEQRQMNLTRLDIAYDDFEGVLDLDVLMRDTLARNFVTRFNGGSINYDFGNSPDEDSGFTVYFGSSSSGTRIRIYDKRVEQDRADLDHWVRCELQLRRENAIGFIKNEEKSIGRKYFGVINNYLRFVTPSETDSNKRRWETADYWLKFIQYADIISIYSKPGSDYDIHKLDAYVFGQCSGAVDTMIGIIGVQRFFEKLLDSRKGKKLNPKYRDLKLRMAEFSAPFRDDNISKYLGCAVS